MLRRFWFEFAVDNPEDLPPGIRLGCGVTARSIEEGTSLIQERVFGGARVPPVTKIIVDVDISTLDGAHVRPNMGNPLLPGIWFPLGY
jgi:hypothetical protein